jgi:carboxymethylenebutenolidase
VPQPGERIELTSADGHRMSAYRALPAGKARGGLVVVQEIFGVNGHVRAVCDEYAGDGYAVIAPALFDRLRRDVELAYTAEGTAEGRALRTRLGWDAPVADLTAAVAALREHGRVGTVGYCWGGSLSFLMACRSEVACVACSVAYYGAQIVQFAEERPRAPVLMHFGERDDLIKAEDRERIQAHQPEAEVFVYPAGHGFNCTERQDYAPESARLAKERTLRFLRAHVG